MLERTGSVVPTQRLSSLGTSARRMFGRPFRMRGRERRWHVVLALLRISAEAGWITVVYAAASVIASHQAPVLGPVDFGFLVGVGVLIARISQGKPGIGAALLIVGVICGGIFGWAADPAARAMVPDLTHALGLHIAGWIGGVAVLRGSILSTGEEAPGQLEKLIGSVPLWLVLVWAYTTFAVRPELWLPFAISAMWGTVLFLSSTLVGIGIARLNELHEKVRDKRQRRAWRLLVFVVGFGVIPIAVPVAVLSGIPLGAVMGPVTGPLQLVLGLLVYPLIFIVWILELLLRPIAPGVGQVLDAMGKAIDKITPSAKDWQTETSPIAVIAGLLLWAFTLVLLIAALLYVARWLLTRRGLTRVELISTGGGIEREIAVPDKRPRERVHLPRLRRRHAPHDAVQAYVSALAELEAHPDLARLPYETPADHAGRLKASGADEQVAADLARLAAGYQLARYGERRITNRENERSVFRWQRVRRLLKASGA